MVNVPFFRLSTRVDDDRRRLRAVRLLHISTIAAAAAAVSFDRQERKESGARIIFFSKKNYCWSILFSYQIAVRFPLFL